MIDYTIFPVRLKEAREKANMKQRELAEQTKMAVQTLSGYENGKKRPTLDNLSLLAETLDVSEAWLLGIDNPIQLPKNCADAYKMIEALEWFFQETVTVKEEYLSPSEYDWVKGRYIYSLSINDIGAVLGNAIIGRNRFYDNEKVDADLMQEMLELWHNKYLSDLKKIKCPWGEEDAE